MRIGTFNLLHGMSVLGGMPEPARDAAGTIVGPPTVLDDRPLRAVVADMGVDVLGIQEVDVHQSRSGGIDQVRSVAAAMNAAHWRFAPSVSGTPGDAIHGWSTPTAEEDESANLGHDTGPFYGVGLVSRLPVLEWRSTRFEAAPFGIPLMIPAEPRPRFIRVPDEPRAALAAVIEGRNGPFTVATVHLSFVPGYNVKQLRQLRKWLAGMPRPLILMGDFNLPGKLPARITGWHSLVRGPTYPVMKPRVQLDHVLADGLPDSARISARGQILPLGISDHCAVVVDVDL